MRVYVYAIPRDIPRPLEVEQRGIAASRETIIASSRKRPVARTSIEDDVPSSSSFFLPIVSRIELLHSISRITLHFSLSNNTPSDLSSPLLLPLPLSLSSDDSRSKISSAIDTKSLERRERSSSTPPLPSTPLPLLAHGRCRFSTERNGEKSGPEARQG